MWSLLLISLICAYISWLWMKYHTVWKHIAKFPGPTALPLVGNLLQIGTKPEDFLATILRWLREYNHECVRLYGGPVPYLVMSNPKNIESILTSTTLTYKEDLYNFFYPWLGQGLLTANGTHWVKHRKIITPSFHFQILQDFLHVINKTTDRFMAYLGTLAEKGEIIDFQEEVTRSTIEVICESAMGTPVNAILGEQSPLVKAINDLCFIIQGRTFSAIKRFDFLFYFTADYRAQNAAIKVVNSELTKIIENRRKILQNQQNEQLTLKDEFKRPKKAFLDNLLTAEKDGQPLTFKEIIEEVSTFMFEGHDTTASAITFAIFSLSRHPEIQAKAFKEQVDIFGNDCQRNPTYQELQEMKYLELVIKETLRLYPSVPFIGRTMKEMTEIDGMVIPAKTTIMLSIIGVATDERNFEQPYTFRPERFDADKPENASNFNYVPFSAGPRNCIGQRFAMMELKVTISKILRNFEVLPPVEGLSSGIHDPTIPNNVNKGPYDPRLAVFVTLKSTNGVHIRLKRREY